MKTEIIFNKLTNSEKMMVNYLLNGMIETLIIDGKECKKDDIEIL